MVNTYGEVARALSIPTYPSIKERRICLDESVFPVDEVEFDAADMNILVTVNVETYRTSITPQNDGLKLKNGIPAGSLLFNELFGDSYVSQVVSGGTAAAVLSIQSLDRSKVQETVKVVKESLNLNDQEASAKLILTSYNKDKPNAFTAALKGTKSHACVSCVGNGNLVTGQQSSPSSLSLPFLTRISCCSC